MRERRWAGRTAEQALGAWDSWLAQCTVRVASGVVRVASFFFFLLSFSFPHHFLSFLLSRRYYTA